MARGSARAGVSEKLTMHPTTKWCIALVIAAVVPSFLVSHFTREQAIDAGAAERVMENPIVGVPRFKWLDGVWYRHRLEQANANELAMSNNIIQLCDYALREFAEDRKRIEAVALLAEQFRSNAETWSNNYQAMLLYVDKEMKKLQRENRLN